jgi:hypothetical protein
LVPLAHIAGVAGQRKIAHPVTAPSSSLSERSPYLPSVMVYS